MAHLAGLNLHLDINFDEIDPQEAEQYLLEITKKYSTLIYGHEVKIHVEVREGSVKAKLAIVGAIYISICGYGSFRSGIDYLIKDAKIVNELVLNELLKNGLNESEIIKIDRTHCAPDKIRRVLLSIERLEAKVNIDDVLYKKELSKIKASVKNICGELDEKDIGIFASSLKSIYLPENTPIPKIAEEYKILAREEEIAYFPSNDNHIEKANKQINRTKNSGLFSLRSSLAHNF